MKFPKACVSIPSAALALGTILSPAVALAQRPGGNDAGAAAAGTAACAGCGVMIFFVVAVAVLHIAILVWVARDAKARGMDSPVLWMLLIIFTGIIGLIVYIFARPQGSLVMCPHCHNKRLQASAKCPHCANP